MSSVPGELPSAIGPDRVCVVPAGGVKNGSPAKVIGFAIVKLPLLRNDSVVPSAIASVPLPRALLSPTAMVPAVSDVPPE